MKSEEANPEIYRLIDLLNSMVYFFWEINAKEKYGMFR